VAALLALAPLTALAAEALPDDVTGVDWVLTSIATDGVMGPVPEGVTPTLRLEDGQVSGSTGCNSFSGPYTLDGTSLTFGALAATAMACEDTNGAVEAPYLVALALVGGWSLTDGTLQLLDAAGQPLLEFSAQAASPEGTTWILAQQAVDQALAPIPDGVLATLLMRDGASGGSGGCNSWFADYNLDGTSLAFSDIGSTFMFCEGPAGEVEQAYFANLADVAMYAIVGSQLNLLSADGATLLVFDAAPAQSIVGSWVATSIAMGGGVVSSETTSAVTADFSPDGAITGSDGCNDYTGTYEVDGRSIAIGDLASTGMACPSDELDEQSIAYGEALAAAAAWNVEANGTLTLYSAEGNVLVTYAPAGA
jgi:heat shock protein HslJ